MDEGGDIATIECDEIKDSFNDTGTYTPRWCNPIDPATGNLQCTNTSGGCDTDHTSESTDVFSGNYLNYENTAVDIGTNQSRTEAAKTVVKKIIEDNGDSISFGLMRLAGSSYGYNGGEMIKACGTSKAELLTAVDAMPAAGNTPLAETLAEAGRYFAGLDTWYGISYTNANIYTTSKYVTPIANTCQNNYVIIMTDGEPTADGLNIRYSNVWQDTWGNYHYDNYGLEYMNGKKIGGADGDGDEDGDRLETISGSGTNMNCVNALDDVAYFLNREDLISSLDGVQGLKISTIGFGRDTSASSAVTLLTDTANNGGGMYFQASTATSLANAFSTIVNNMIEDTNIFVAPVVPVNRVRRTADSDLIYLAFFKPQENGGWLGNIKKYNLVTKENCAKDGRSLCTDIGAIYDRDWKSAVAPDGTIADNALDYWAEDTVGNTGSISMGGLGEQLMTRTTARSLYTYIDHFVDGTGTTVALTDKNLVGVDKNKFATTNTYIKGNPYNLTDVLINRVHGNGASWKLGDIIHAEPVVAHYIDKSVIFAGTNDAVFHCFDDTTGDELWGFVPQDQFARLDLINSSDHYSFIDGGITATYKDPMADDVYSQILKPRSVIFGERRGGTSYFALNIEDYSKPVFMYQIAMDYLKDYASSGYEALGQSWSKPSAVKVSVGLDTESRVATKQDAFVMTGGYDEGQDADSPSADDTGRAVFIIDELTGTLIHGWGPMAPADTNQFVNVPEMEYCVTDVLATQGTAYSGDNAGIVNRLYFGDLGGDVFAIADDILKTVEDVEGVATVKVNPKLADGTWNVMKKVFNGGDGRKILDAPAVVTLCDKELVLFGTGDRAHPNEKTVENRFYCVINDWANETPVTESQLVDVTLGGTSSDYGWYITLGLGEKVVSTPLVYNKTVIFTTYTPPDETIPVDESDPCGFSGVRGKGLIYLVTMECSNGELIVPPWDPPKTPPGDFPKPTIADGQLRYGAENDPLPIDNSSDYFFWRQQ